MQHGGNWGKNCYDLKFGSFYPNSSLGWMPISGPVQSYSLVLPGLTNGPGPVDQPMDNVWSGCLFSHWESQTSPQYEVKLEEPGQDNCLAAMCDAMHRLTDQCSILQCIVPDCPWCTVW